MSKYLVLSGQAGGMEYEHTAHTLKEARSIAYRQAIKLRYDNTRPVWVDGGRSWNSTAAIGGYDASENGDGSVYAVVEVSEE